MDYIHYLLSELVNITCGKNNKVTEVKEMLHCVHF